MQSILLMDARIYSGLNTFPEQVRASRIKIAGELNDTGHAHFLVKLTTENR